MQASRFSRAATTTSPTLDTTHTVPVTHERPLRTTLLAAEQKGRVLIRHFTKSLGAAAIVATTILLGTSAAVAASQNASNSADSAAANASLTKQGAGQSQDANSSSGNDGCYSFCTGGGGNLTLQSQFLGQAAFTDQWASSAALAKQNAVNANVPVTIAGKGHIDSSPSSANQWADNSASSNATNASATKQGADQNQNANSSSGNSGCYKFCTGGGGNITKQGQDLAQLAHTNQNVSRRHWRSRTW